MGLRRAEALRLAVPLAVVGALALAWQLPASRRLLAGIPELLEVVAGLPAAPLLVIGAFMVAGLAAVPLTALVVATAAVFGPWQGLALSWVGGMLSAMLVFVVGRLFGRTAFRRLLGERGRRLSERVADRGVVAVAVMRNVPVAPYSVVNLAAGASPIRPLDFALGTAIGLAPGLLLLTVAGDRLAGALRSPSLANLGLLAAVLLVFAGFGVVAARRLGRDDAAGDG